MPKGDCYAANGRWMIGKKNYQLVHGVAILASDGKPFGHCWIEYGNMVFDFTDGRKIKLSKNIILKITLLVLPFALGFIIGGTSACETFGSGVIIEC